MNPIGVILVVSALLAPVPWFFAIAASHDAVAAFSQYLGVSALVAMGISQLLSTRARWLQHVFGGLDRMYVLHKWLGIGAIASAFLHDVVDAEMKSLGPHGVLADIAEELGEIGYYALLVLGLLSVISFVPYHLWRWTHRLMGTAFAMCAVHYAFITKPFALGDPLGLYVLSFCLIGVLSYVYALALYARVPGPAAYRVTSARLDREALELELAPSGRGLVHRPGQFVFLEFELDGLTEAHPFTVSSAPGPDRALSFGIKPVGGYTRALAGAVREGTGVRVFGPYGRFVPPRGAARQIWIAAGIGITPFRAWAQALESDSGGPVHLFYCVRHAAGAPYLPELSSTAENLDRFDLTVVESSRGERLDAAMLQRALAGESRRVDVYFCGPPAMRRDLVAAAAALGLPRRRFHFEAFEIRSGLGIRRQLERFRGIAVRRDAVV